MTILPPYSDWSRQDLGLQNPFLFLEQLLCARHSALILKAITSLFFGEEPEAETLKVTYLKSQGKRSG